MNAISSLVRIAELIRDRRLAEMRQAHDHREILRQQHQDLGRQAHSLVPEGGAGAAALLNADRHRAQALMKRALMSPGLAQAEADCAEAQARATLAHGRSLALAALERRMKTRNRSG